MGRNYLCLKTAIILFILVSPILLHMIIPNNAENQTNLTISMGTTRYYDPLNDTDMDGIEDSDDPDDDNDGMPDSWELNWIDYAKSYGIINRFDTKNASDASEDWDEDGYSNLNEYISDTNPYDNTDYPKFAHSTQRYDDDWERFLAFLILTIFGVMVIAIIIGIIIIRKRKRDEEFWTQAFGSNTGEGIRSDESGNIAREGYIEWRNRIDGTPASKMDRRHKYELEIIGGPDDELGPGQTRRLLGRSGDRLNQNRPDTKKDPRFKGRYCLWCDRAITNKYIKRCPEPRSKDKRCNDGPFCSRKCLNEHLKLVPHYQEVDF